MADDWRTLFGIKKVFCPLSILNTISHLYIAVTAHILCFMEQLIHCHDIWVKRWRFLRQDIQMWFLWQETERRSAVIDVELSSCCSSSYLTWPMPCTSSKLVSREDDKFFFLFKFTYYEIPYDVGLCQLNDCCVVFPQCGLYCWSYICYHSITFQIWIELRYSLVLIDPRSSPLLWPKKKYRVLIIRILKGQFGLKVH